MGRNMKNNGFFSPQNDVHSGGVGAGSSYNNIDFFKVPEDYKISQAASKISKVTLDACI